MKEVKRRWIARRNKANYSLYIYIWPSLHVTLYMSCRLYDMADIAV